MNVRGERTATATTPPVQPPGSAAKADQPASGSSVDKSAEGEAMMTGLDERPRPNLDNQIPFVEHQLRRDFF